MNWILLNWRQLLSVPAAHVALALAAVVCGVVVGSEREKREKPAGLRTLALVCLGSTVFTMVSYAFGTTTGDTGRVAAQIVTGIGFIGAGVILHGQAAVTGITTAATIWATAAMGIVVGVGYAGAGLALSALIRLVLTVLAWWEQNHLAEIQVTHVELLVDPDHGKTQLRLECIIEQFHAGNCIQEITPNEHGLASIRLRLRLPKRHRAEFLNQLAGLPELREIRRVPSQDIR